MSEQWDIQEIAFYLRLHIKHSSTGVKEERLCVSFVLNTRPLGAFWRDCLGYPELCVLQDLAEDQTRSLTHYGF